MSRVRMTRPRRALVWALAPAVSTLTLLADAWSPGTQQPFSLPTAAKPAQPVWNGPKGGRVAVKVRTSSGEVRAQQPVGTPVGTVPANATCVWEGMFESFTIEGTAPGTATGTTEVRTQSTNDLDRLVGAGMLSLPLPSGATGFTYYASDTPLSRLTRVKAGGSTVTVSADGASLVVVDPGDTVFCLRTTDDFGLSGGGTTEFHVYDMADGAATWQYGGTASRQAGDAGDGLTFDGSAQVKVTLTNTSASGQVVIASSHPCTPSTTLAPGQSATATGALTTFAWTYQGGATSVSFQVANP